LVNLNIVNGDANIFSSLQEYDKSHHVVIENAHPPITTITIELFSRLAERS
jgi:hypothetical protein